MSDIGYKKPPKHTQYKKGQSGNPKGRPKKVEASMMDQILDVFEEPVKVTINARTKQVPQLLVLIRQHMKKGIEGNTTSAKLAMNLFEKKLLPILEKKHYKEAQRKSSNIQPEPKTPAEAAQFFNKVLQEINEKD